jgi:RimJ/RimL family protein N-acetyltransferase
MSAENPLRSEEVTLRDGRHVVVRPADIRDLESLMRNANLVGAEQVYIMLDQLDDLDDERRWLSSFDGVRSVLIVADAGGEVVGSADCDGGSFAKDRHVGRIGIAIREGYREVGLGRILMTRVLDWMAMRGFEKAELAVFASNTRALRLYESLGFLREGVRKNHVKIRGEYEDEVVMGMMLPRNAAVKTPSNRARRRRR